MYGAGNDDVDFLLKDLAGWESDTVQVLVRTLEEAGIRVGAFGRPELPDDTLRILIHPKP